MARVSTYLNFPGTTEDAFNFYRSVFGGDFNGPLHRFGGMPPQPGQPPMSDALKNRLDAESDVLFGTARLWDDGVIDPRDTRRILALCLNLAREAEQRTLRANTFGVARL